MHLERVTDRGAPLATAHWRRGATDAERRLPLAKALSGLIAALTAADELDAAADLLQQSLPAIARSTWSPTSTSRPARAPRRRLAACLLTASCFRTRRDQRVPIVQRCRDEVAAKVAEHATPELGAEWRRVGQEMSEADVVRSIAASLAAAARSPVRNGKTV